MRLLEMLRRLLPHDADPWADDDERLREAEQRVNVLDATIGAQQAQHIRDRDRREMEGQRANR